MKLRNSTGRVRNIGGMVRNLINVHTHLDVVVS